MARLLHLPPHRDSCIERPDRNPSEMILERKRRNLPILLLLRLIRMPGLGEDELGVEVESDSCWCGDGRVSWSRWLSSREREEEGSGFARSSLCAV
jgi:hypothetical protein